MSNNFKSCPYCGKLISSDATFCKHCNRTLNTISGNYFYTDFLDKLLTLWNNSFGGKCIIIFGICVTWFILDNLWFNFSTSSTYVKGDINPKIEAEQVLIQPKTIKYKDAQFKLMAQYSLSGMVIAKNTNFFMPFTPKTEFNKIVPIDFGIAWGELADKNLVKKHIRCTSVLYSNGGRRLGFSWKNLDNIGNSYVKAHISHNHIIPKNNNIKKAIWRLSEFDNVKFDGYLVDITFKDTSTAMTSLSRTDEDSSARGGGACEIFYVTGVQIGHRYYK